MNRRQLITNGLKAALGVAAMQNVSSAQPVLIAERMFSQADRFAPAFKRLDEFIVRHMSEIGAPGMTVSLANRNGLLRSSQYGFADVKSGLKVTPQTLFEIGSISKSFVAMAILQQAEQGKLDLHKPVAEYLPWLKVDSRFPPFTTHHLLSHTSGLSGVPLLMRVAATTLRTGSAPGTEFVYSNIGYDLLGFILEAIDKKPFAEIMQRRVLQPLGMTSSAPIISNEIREQMALGYWPLKPDRPFPLRGKLGEAPWVEVPEAAGSIAATTADMGNYLRMLMNRGAGASGRVLAEKTFESFIKPVISSPFRGEAASYAYGLWVSDINGNTLLRHTGGMVAFSSAMYADITEGVAAFASVNARLAGGYRPVPVTKYALELLSAASRGHELPPLPAPLPSPATIKNAADYAGTFTSTDGKKLVLTSNAEQLILQHGGAGIVLEQAGRDRFLVKHPDFELFALSFGRDKDRVVEAFHGADWWVSQDYSGPKSFEHPKEWAAYTGHFRADSPWYGSMRLVIRKGQLMIDGEQSLVPVEANVFRPPGDGGDADRLVFDMLVHGQATRLNFSGIEFFRTFTP
jgi:CubicO group peptidase (beta-lactamase class C family)